METAVSQNDVTYGIRLCPPAPVDLLQKHIQQPPEVQALQKRGVEGEISRKKYLLYYLILIRQLSPYLNITKGTAHLLIQPTPSDQAGSCITCLMNTESTERSTQKVKG